MKMNKTFLVKLVLGLVIALGLTSLVGLAQAGIVEQPNGKSEAESVCPACESERALRLCGSVVPNLPGSENGRPIPARPVGECGTEIAVQKPDAKGRADGGGNR